LITIYAPPSDWPPQVAKVQKAWEVLREPVKSYIKALIKLKETYPPKLPDETYDEWFERLYAKALNDYEPVIEAIIRGAELGSTVRATNALVDRARNRGPTYLDLTDLGIVERKVHVLDSLGRVLFLRCWKIDGQPLKLLDHQKGAELAIATIQDSHWDWKDGWRVTGGRRPRKTGTGTPEDGGGSPEANEEPKPTI